MQEPRYRLLGVFFVLGAIVMFMPLHFPVYEGFLERLMDPMHAVFFGGVTWLLTVTNPLGIVGHRPRLVVAILLSAFAAGAVEVLQSYTGRDESFDDFRDGVFGVVLVGSAMWRPLRQRSRTFIVAWCAVAVLLAVIGFEPAWEEARGLIWRVQHFPVLADFESDEEMRLWVSAGLSAAPLTDTSMGRRAERASHGEHSLIVLTSPPGPWPGVRLICDGQDWTGYNALAFDIYDDYGPANFALRIDDDGTVGGNDNRYNRALPLVHGWNHFRIPLTEIEHGPRVRALRMNAIRRVVFFRDHPRDGSVIYLDYLRLER